MINPKLAIEVAYGKGNLKKWSLEKVIMEVLYDTEPSHACYLKLKEVSPKDYDEETETEYIVKFGYLFRFPKTEIDLHINKKTHLLYATKEGIGYGYDAVEDQVVKYIFDHKKKKNLLYQSSLNAEVFEVK